MTELQFSFWYCIDDMDSNTCTSIRCCTWVTRWHVGQKGLVMTGRVIRNVYMSRLKVHLSLACFLYQARQSMVVFEERDIDNVHIFKQPTQHFIYMAALCFTHLRFINCWLLWHRWSSSLGIVFYMFQDPLLTGVPKTYYIITCTTRSIVGGNGSPLGTPGSCDVEW